jgi:putative holliday junction resolvase
MSNRVNGRRVAFDYGDVRIGVAVSDASGLLASPYGIVLTEQDPFGEIKKIVEEFSPIYFAVGIPRHLSGKPSAKMASVEDFIEALKRNFNIPVVRIDERLSTVSAARSLRDSGKNTKQAKGLIDAAAAATILEVALSQEVTADE